VQAGRSGDALGASEGRAAVAKELDDGEYAYSWCEEPGETHTYDQDSAGATSHL
jgi:hypothetical protein